MHNLFKKSKSFCHQCIIFNKYIIRTAKFDVDKYGRQEDLEAWRKTEIIKEQTHSTVEVNFFGAIEMFVDQGKNRQGATEFIYDMLSKMKQYKVHKELDAYKELLKVFPIGVMVPTNSFQVEFFHFPKQQTCAIEVLDKMEHNGVAPDEELYDILRKRFGEWTHVLRKFRRAMYWKAKFKNINPFLMPSFDLTKLNSQHLESDEIVAIRQLLNAQLVLYRIFDGVDRDFLLNTFYEQPLATSNDSYNETSVISKSAVSAVNTNELISFTPQKWPYTLQNVTESKKDFKEKLNLQNVQLLPPGLDETGDICDKISQGPYNIKNWSFITAQSPKQKEIIKNLNESHRIFIEGPYLSWIQDNSVRYYQIRAEFNSEDLSDAQRVMDINERDYDDVSNWTLFNEVEGTPMSGYPVERVHELMPDASKYLGFVIFRQDFRVANDFEGPLNEPTTSGSEEQTDVIPLKKSALNAMRHALVYEWLKSLEKNLDNAQLSKLPIIIRLNDDPNDLQTYLKDESFVNSRTRDHSRPLNFEEMNRPVYKF